MENICIPRPHDFRTICSCFFFTTFFSGANSVREPTYFPHYLYERNRRYIVRRPKRMSHFEKIVFYRLVQKDREMLDSCMLHFIVGICLIECECDSLRKQSLYRSENQSQNLTSYHHASRKKRASVVIKSK